MNENSRLQEVRRVHVIWTGKQERRELRILAHRAEEQLPAASFLKTVARMHEVVSGKPENDATHGFDVRNHF